ncbi:MAG: sulfatase-like hydrolase/transferase [Verrucomicrobiales bacterium]|nr:sulfatase-like hydrolase/transferase [Verrucomicrobiales bacterium]
MKPLVAFLLTLFSLTALSAERPNIILIMVDDMGFSDLGYQGGEIDTPNLDALAHGGVRFSQFYNSGRCCPTRATLMTGLHPHQTGIGHMTNPPNSKGHDHGVPGYRGFLNRQCVTVAEVLKESGYATLMTGKWHLGHSDKDMWPLQRGFEKYYGCIPGATRFFHPTEVRGMTSGNEPVAEPASTTDEAFYTTDAFTDHAVDFINHHLTEDKEKPYFLYLAYTAPHWPLQAFEDDIAKYRGKYKSGWEKLRESRHKRQIELGLIDEKLELSPPTPGIPAWDSLDEKKQDEMDLKMAVYAAMVDRVDQNIGKLVASLKETGTFDNTLILFLSDNGACQEGGMLGRGEFYDIEKRNLNESNSYGEAWANAGNTPFRLYKHFAHEGGTATPFFIHWPAAIDAKSDWYSDPAQLIDVMPTILDVAGAQYPGKFHGNPIPELEGVSLRPAFGEKPLGRENPIFVEHENNAFVRDGQWKLVGRGVAADSGVDASKWELYDMVTDRTETNNLAATHPDKVKELAEKWQVWADRSGVYPKRLKTETGPVPDPPGVRGQAFTVTATIRNPKPHGAVIAHGGVRYGYSLHFINGKPAFSIRDEGKLTELVGDTAVKGKTTVSATLDEKEVTLSVNGKVVARGPSPGLISSQPGIGLYIGQDFKDPVGKYKSPNRFNGKILDHKVQVVIPKVTMRTPWADEVTPDNVWQEYPRPQLRRDNWTNLNGLWDYAVTTGSRQHFPEKWDGKILVPFAIEAPLSGVEKRFSPDDALWYQREVTIKKGGKRHLLNFEAVDYETQVWVNGIKIGTNIGGNLPFSFDVTDALKDGSNIVTLRVTDATDSKYQLHGKQRLNPKGIWYTPVSGIWQTVWLEEVPETYITGLKITTQIDGTGEIGISTSADTDVKPSIEVSLNGKTVFKNNHEGSFKIVDPQLWSPESPTLYDLKVQVGEDLVTSYFGIRETGIRKDENGHLRFTLNGKPIFHWGTLDQGWWPDGLLTPPSEAAMVSDIEFLKNAGFNTIRKHIKVEPRRYYYHCDKMGMLVWQDQVSAMADNPEWTRLLPDPPTVTWPEAAHAQFMAELKLMIDTLHNHPSIVQWVPFNERWGQHQTVETGQWTVKYDPTRQVNIASGGNFFPAGHIVDAHKYPHPEFPFDQDNGRFDGYIKVMGEFGGHGFPVDGHVWAPGARNWGYGGLPKDKNEWLERYRTSIEKLAELKKQGIAAGIYTQTTDVEGEINGLITYDRKVQKIDPEELKSIAGQLFE